MWNMDATSTDIPYSRLLQVPDEEHGFLNLEEFKPHQLSELEILNPTAAACGASDIRFTQNSHAIANNLIPNELQYQLQHQLQYQLQHQPHPAASQQSNQHQIYNQIQQHLQSQQPNQQQLIQSYQIPTIAYASVKENNASILDNSGSVKNSDDDDGRLMQLVRSDMQSTYQGNHDHLQHQDESAQQYHHQSSQLQTCRQTSLTDLTQYQLDNQVYYQPHSENSFDPSANCSVYSTELAYNLPSLDEQQNATPHYQKAQSSILPSSYASNLRKRKAYYTTDASDYEGDTGDDSKFVRTSDENKKQNHSEIEKRRRDKMNTYITELSTMVPMCHAMSRKLDKLTVLRMAVQHLKTIRGAVHPYTEGHYKPSFLSDQELKKLILQATDGFLFVVGCDRGRILYVSESVSQTLNYSQGDLLGQSWFDILHPNDVVKVKEQLSSSDLRPREKLIDAKTMLPVKIDVPQGESRLCPGARRSFFCRMKCKSSMSSEDGANLLSNCHRRKKQLSSDKKYSVIQCTGYLKSWAQTKIGLEERETDSDYYTCNLSCLVAVGRIVPNVFDQNSTQSNHPNLRMIQFISRHAMDGKFLFVDQRATLVLGFLPQELLGTSMYEYYQYDDIPALAEAHKAALQATDKVTTSIYRFRTKENDFVRLQSEWKSFKNPWTKEVEYLIAKNSVIFDTLPENNSFNTTANSEAANGRKMHRVINTHDEASKIGRQIAEEMLNYHRRARDSSCGSSPDPENLSINSLNPKPSSSSSSGENQMANNDQLNLLAMQRDLEFEPQSRINGTITHFDNAISTNRNSDTEVIGLLANSTISESSNQITNSEGNDEAAMAVIMSLLEADAGLGGPVDFTGLPWPLP